MEPYGRGGGFRYRVFCASLADVFDNEVGSDGARRYGGSISRRLILIGCS